MLGRAHSVGKFTCVGVILFITSELYQTAVVFIKAEYLLPDRSLFFCSLGLKRFLTVSTSTSPAPNFDLSAPESLIRQFLAQFNVS